MSEKERKKERKRYNEWRKEKRLRTMWIMGTERENNSSG